MKNLDRFVKVMQYGDFDHPPLYGEGPWADTYARWYKEGLAPNTGWEQVFGVKPLGIAHHGFNEGLCPHFEPRVIEETDEFVVKIDSTGCTIRDFRHHTSMPEWLDYPVKDRASFEAVLDRFQLNFDERFPKDFDERVRQWNAPEFDALLLPPAGAYYNILRALAGPETISYLFYDCPDLIHRINEVMCEASCRFAERMLPSTPNVYCIGTGEDLAFKTGPLVSPTMFEEFFVPYYRRVSDIAHRHNVNLFFLDSDGNFDVLVPQMLEVGINLFNPVEVAAGMDPVALRQKYGRAFRMIGGVDKRIVAAGKEPIRKEMERLFPLMCEGGFIPKIDHSVSSDISWDNFRYYMDTLLEMHERCAHRAGA
jgi:hypothetical protein